MGKKWKGKTNQASEHYIEKCSCGEKIGGCRCSAGNKKIVIIEKGCAKCKKSEISNSQYKKEDVNQINNNKDILKNNTNMTIKSLKELNDESLKTATASEIIKAHKVDLDAEVEKISKEWESKRDEVKNKLSEAEQKNAELEAKAKETADKLAKVQEDLNKLIKAAQDKEAEDIFSARMNYFDAEFELDEKSRNAVANRIKGLDEAGYKQEKEDLEVLLAAKKKGKKEEMKEDKKEEKKETKASVEKVDDKTTSSVVEDAIDKGTKVVATVAATTTVTETNADKFAKAFGKDNWVIDPRVLRK